MERSNEQWAASAVFPSYLNDDTQPTPNVCHTPAKATTPTTTTMDDGYTTKLILLDHQ